MLKDAIRNKLFDEAEAFIRIGLETLDEAELEKSRRKPKLEFMVRLEALRQMGIEHWAEIELMNDADIEEFFNLVLSILRVN